MEQLEINQCVQIETGIYIRRVPGGWVYEYRHDGNYVFVPEPKIQHSIEITQEEADFIKELFVE